MSGLTGMPGQGTSGSAPLVSVTRAPAPSGPLVALGLMVFAVIWLPHLAVTSLSPPVDNIEQLTWVRALQWGYYKHPPLPTWLLWLPVKLLGLSDWTSYLLGAATTLGAMGVFWALLKALRGPTYAALALLAALCITYYNGRLNYYNHNVVLLMVVVVSAWCCWRAFEEKRLRWWFALGVVMGLGALTKYQVAVTAVSVLCFWVSQGAWRERLHVRGLLLATLTALVVFTPHLLWLPAHDFGPIRYAMGTSLAAHLGAAGRMLNAGNWAADQLLNRSLPAFLFLGACAYRAARCNKQALDAIAPVPVDRKPGSRALILSWAIVPLVFMPAMGVVFGSDLQLQWGTAFLPFVVPAAMELRPVAFWMRMHRRFTVQAFMTVQGLLLVLNFVTSPIGFDKLKDRHWRTFDAKAFSEGVAAPARSLLGGHILAVVGEPAITGALALQLPERPVVLIDGQIDDSPWVPKDLVSRCGAVEIVRAQRQPATATPVGAAFPGIYWRAIHRSPNARPCRD